MSVFVKGFMLQLVFKCVCVNVCVEEDFPLLFLEEANRLYELSG